MKAIELCQKRVQLITELGKITEKAHSENPQRKPGLLSRRERVV